MAIATAARQPHAVYTGNTPAKATLSKAEVADLSNQERQTPKGKHNEEAETYIPNERVKPLGVGGS